LEVWGFGLNLARALGALARLLQRQRCAAALKDGLRRGADFDETEHHVERREREREGLSEISFSSPLAFVVRIGDPVPWSTKLLKYTGAGVIADHGAIARPR
jgi:hypothetical protein